MLFFSLRPIREDGKSCLYGQMIKNIMAKHKEIVSEIVSAIITGHDAGSE
jgi:hypothetical protein